jgi:hypothetical protein
MFTLFQSRDQVLTDSIEKVTSTQTARVLVTATTVFHIHGGWIHIFALASECVTANDTTASTLQWSADGTLGSAVTITAASATLASAAPGALLLSNLTALNTAPDLLASGVGLGPVLTRGVVVPAGILTTTIGVGSSTGTWRHHIRYKPLGRGVTVRPAF